MSAQGVKDGIDAQSGRFEFLKQTLTLGLAGLAGIAAIFTDTTKIPSDRGAIVAVSAIGLSLLALVGASLMGLSVYANLLKAHSKGTDVEGYHTSMVRHARGVFVSIVLVALAFVVYAGLQVGQRGKQPITAGEAIAIARTAMASAGCDAVFETVERKTDSYLLIFQSGTCRRRFAIVIKGAEGIVTIRPASQAP